MQRKKTFSDGTVVEECLNAETLFEGKQKDEMCEKIKQDVDFFTWKCRPSIL